MIAVMDWVFVVAGMTVLGLVLWDVFQSVVVPRPTPGRFRLARYVILPIWRAWRWLGLRTRSGLSRDSFLGLYAPGAAVLLLVLWLSFLTVGYGLVLFGLRGEIIPSPSSLVEAIYFAGTSLLTLGYGEIVAGGTASRFVVLFAAATGLGVVALVITFLFSLFANYQRREVLVVTLSARAKSPPSAVTLLETYAHLGMVDQLPRLFREWEGWTAEVLDSHVAYPLLGYFRSSHDNISWISALGAVLDAAALVVTTIRGVPRGQAEITKRVGAHLVEDIANILGLSGAGRSVDLEGFRDVYDRLSAAGYDLEPIDGAWHTFEHARSSYAGGLEAMAAFWATPATAWDGHRTAGASVVHADEGISAPAAAGRQEVR
jgi:voltage-gated potassium channel Kch